MIIFTKQGDRSSMPYLFAFDRGVYVFQFFGETSYTDEFDGSSWFWEGIDNSIDEVLGVIQEGTPLLQALTLDDCIIQESSWFWDDTNGYLYVHWLASTGDWHVDREASILSKIAAGYASGYVDDMHNVFDGVYYRPIITAVKGLSKSVDPLELGLISFGKSSFSLSNFNGEFDYIRESEAVGLPVWFYAGDQDTTELTNDMRIFTGFMNGSKNNRDNIEFDIIETRLYENKRRQRHCAYHLHTRLRNRLQSLTK